LEVAFVRVINLGSAAMAVAMGPVKAASVAEAKATAVQLTVL